MFHVEAVPSVVQSYMLDGLSIPYMFGSNDATIWKSGHLASKQARAARADAKR